jgi:hypothetical protein
VNPGRLAALKSFFGVRILPMFTKDDMTSFGYFVPQDQPESENL